MRTDTAVGTDGLPRDLAPATLPALWGAGLTRQTARHKGGCRNRTAGPNGPAGISGGNDMRKLTLLLAAATMALAGASPALAKKQLVIVVKGLDNPFFEAINQGCQKWNSENASSEYECFYTGPASTSDEVGEAQIIQDMLGKADTVAMAISPSNAKLIAQTLKTAAPTIPIMTLDADLAADDAALRKTYLGTDNYLLGFKLGEYIKKAKPNGGKICSIQGNPGADNILRRAQGTRDALTGQKGIAALAGEAGWTEVSGCPVFTNDDGAKGVQAMTDILAANPDLDAFAIEGGWPLFGAPQPYRDLFKPLADRIASGDFVIAAADTIGDEVAIAREGLVTALVGQRPFEMGYKAPSVMIDLIEGKPVEDPVFTGLDECTKDTVDTCIQK
jgi:ribose transport system substrate-binding protein